LSKTARPQQDGWELRNLETAMAHLPHAFLKANQTPADPAPAGHGGARSKHSAAAARHAPELPWPEDLLALFSLRMSSHGMSISRIDMLVDAHYALQQLAYARDMGDASLALMADELFRCFQAHQSGLPLQAH
jgi:hypothetical protein